MSDNDIPVRPSPSAGSLTQTAALTKVDTSRASLLEVRIEAIGGRWSAVVPLLRSAIDELEAIRDPASKVDPGRASPRKPAQRALTPQGARHLIDSATELVAASKADIRAGNWPVAAELLQDAIDQLEAVRDPASRRPDDLPARAPVGRSV